MGAVPSVNHDTVLRDDLLRERGYLPEVIACSGHVTYPACAICGGPIPPRRLALHSSTCAEPNCVAECKRARERRNDARRRELRNGSVPPVTQLEQPEPAVLEQPDLFRLASSLLACLPQPASLSFRTANLVVNVQLASDGSS